jgi:hypothetical protein
MKLKTNLLVLVFLAHIQVGWGQPVKNMMRVIEGLEIFPDHKSPGLFYYGPGKLQLASDVDGKPKFQFIQMRYTGTGVYGDRGENRFLNIIEFSVSMEEPEIGVIDKVKSLIGVRHAELRPFPIRSVDAVLIAPVRSGEHNRHQKVGDGVPLQAVDKPEVTTGVSYWRERTFTLRLEDHEAQLIEDQLQEGQLALSLGYSFQADFVAGRVSDGVFSGRNTTRADPFNPATALQSDTIIATHTIGSDAFPIYLDVLKWPDLIRKVDINEGVPPAYAALEVKCFDFTNDLRPDLAMKAIDIEATGVSGRPVILNTKKFIASTPDHNIIQIRFPYAIRLDEPFRYRVTEWTKAGTRKTSDWITAESWVTSLDITTPAQQQLFESRLVEVEVGDLGLPEVDEVTVQLLHMFDGKERSAELRFHRGDPTPVRMANLRVDIGSQIYYKVFCRKGDEVKHDEEWQEFNPPDGYLFLEVQD